MNVINELQPGSSSARTRRTRKRQVQKKKNAAPPSNAPRTTRKQGSRQSLKAPSSTTFVMHEKLKPCTYEYLKAVADPFGSYASDQLPCIPDSNTIPSWKFATIKRGTFSTSSTTGVGFVSISPNVADSSTSAVSTTDPTFAGNTFVVAVTTGVSANQNAQLPFTSANCPAKRNVACGLRVRCIAKQIDLGGQIIPARASDASDTLSLSGSTELLSRPNVITHECDRKWHGVTWVPSDIVDMEYRPRLGSDAVNDSSGQGMRLGVLIVAPSATTSISYEYEAVWFMEYVPDTIAGTLRSVPNTTPTHSDLPGLSAVRDFFGSIKQLDPGPALLRFGQAFLDRGGLQHIVSLATLGAATRVTSRPVIEW